MPSNRRLRSIVVVELHRAISSRLRSVSVPRIAEEPEERYTFLQAPDAAWPKAPSASTGSPSTSS